MYTFVYYSGLIKCHDELRKVLVPLLAQRQLIFICFRKRVVVMLGDNVGCVSVCDKLPGAI